MRLLLSASLAASFALPTAFWTFPRAFSAWPSACVLASPFTLPAASLTAPFACLPIPSTRSLSIVRSPLWLVHEGSNVGIASRFRDYSAALGTMIGRRFPASRSSARYTTGVV